MILLNFTNEKASKFIQILVSVFILNFFKQVNSQQQINNKLIIFYSKPSVFYQKQFYYPDQN